MYRHILNISFLFLCLFNASLNSDQIDDNLDSKETCDSSTKSPENNCADSKNHEGNFKF